MSSTSLFTNQETNKPEIAACKYTFPDINTPWLLLNSIPTNIKVIKQDHMLKTIEVILTTEKTRLYRISTP